MKHLNWKNDDSGGGMMAWASRAVGGKYRVGQRRRVVLKLDAVNLTPGACGRYAGCWDNKPVKHQPVARNWAEAIAVAEADNDQRRAIKERGVA